MENQKKQPEKTFRAGSVSATIWKNTNKVNNEDVSFYTTSIIRSYKDAEGNWKTTSIFRMNDLPKLQLVSKRAYEYTIENLINKKNN